MTISPQNYHLSPARRRRRLLRLPELIEMFEAEDAIVRACAATPNPVAASIAVAEEALRLYDEQLPHIPQGAWLYIADNDDRDELKRKAAQEPAYRDFGALSSELVREWSARLLGDELFLSASNALSHFWARRSWPCN